MTAGWEFLVDPGSDESRGAGTLLLLDATLLTRASGPDGAVHDLAGICEIMDLGAYADPAMATTWYVVTDLSAFIAPRMLRDVWRQYFDHRVFEAGAGEAVVLYLGEDNATERTEYFGLIGSEAVYVVVVICVDFWEDRVAGRQDWCQLLNLVLASQVQNEWVAEDQIENYLARGWPSPTTERLIVVRRVKAGFMARGFELTSCGDADEDLSLT